MNYFERFISASGRFHATYELAELGTEAIPILQSLFDGSAKNSFGISYNKIGAIHCGYVTIKLLGPIAKPLERYVKEGIDQNFTYAIEAAGYLLDLEEETVIALANATARRNPDAVYSLVRCGQSDNPKVIEIISQNELAIKWLESAKKYF